MSEASACSVRASMTGRTPPPCCAVCVTISLHRRRCRYRRCCRPRSGAERAASCALRWRLRRRRRGVPVSTPLSSRAYSRHPARTATTATRSARHWRCPTRELSPTRFSNSVHNAPAGYWSIATGAKRESNVLCAFDASFCAGLLEALAHVVVEEQPVLLVAYDTDYPEPLHAKRPIPDAFGAAFVLTPHRERGSLARIEASLAEQPGRRVDRSAARGAARLHPRRALPAVAAAAGDAATGAHGSRLPRWIRHGRAGRSMRLNRAWIEAHIPHSGRMCLLDEVISWRSGTDQLPQQRTPCSGSSAARTRPSRRCLRRGTGGASDGRSRCADRPRVRSSRLAPDSWRAFAACGCTLHGSTTWKPISSAMPCALPAMREPRCMNSNCVRRRCH